MEKQGTVQSGCRFFPALRLRGPLGARPARVLAAGTVRSGFPEGIVKDAALWPPRRFSGNLAAEHGRSHVSVSFGFCRQWQFSWKTRKLFKFCANERVRL